jgi:enoyl-CoA hydratase
MSTANEQETHAGAVRCEQRGRILVITLNRPDVLNAINAAVAHGLVDAVKRLDEDPGLAVGVLTGAGKNFCAGMDLKAFARGEEMGPSMHFIRHGARKPLIAAVEGYAVAGGLEFALVCDLIVAAKGSKFGIPEAKVGLIAAGGGILRLPSRVGFSKAMELAITGEPILAEEAAALGLVSRVTEVGDALEGAIELAELIARNAPLSVMASKELIQATIGMSEAEFWAYQESFRERIFSSNDSKEGPAAFAQKRPPKWTAS